MGKALIAGAWFSESVLLQLTIMKCIWSPSDLSLVSMVNSALNGFQLEKIAGDQASYWPILLRLSVHSNGQKE